MIMCLTYNIHPFVGCVIVTVLAGGKEVYDYKKKGSVEQLDILFTVLGGALGFLCMILPTLLKQ